MFGGDSVPLRFNFSGKLKTYQNVTAQTIDTGSPNHMAVV